MGTFAPHAKVVNWKNSRSVMQMFDQIFNLLGDEEDGPGGEEPGVSGHRREERARHHQVALLRQPALLPSDKQQCFLGEKSLL